MEKQLKIGEQISGYKVVRLIGKGGMGEVYEGFETALHRKVALKVISQRVLQDADAVERFRSEGRALARLVHPNVVSVYSLLEQENRLILVMEYVDGLTLDQFMLTRPYGLKDALEICKKMAEGLKAVHEAAIVHRDLKPQNVMIGRDLSVKLIDFGISKAHAGEPASVQTAAEIVIGTVNYLAPEVLNGQTADTRSDIYALGLIFYFVFTGRVPFKGKSNVNVISAIHSSQLDFSSRVEQVLPAELIQIVKKMTAKYSNDRYASLDAVLTELNGITLNDLPMELVRPAAHFVIENQEELREVCRTRGFENSEINLILGLASELEAGQSSDPEIESDQTQRLVPNAGISITTETLEKAIQRFQTAQSSAVTARTRKAKATESKKFSPEVFQWAGIGAILALIVYCAMLFFPGKRVIKTPSASLGPRFETHEVGEEEWVRTREMNDGKVSREYTRHWKLVQLQGDLETWVEDDGATLLRNLPYLNPIRRYKDPIKGDSTEERIGDGKALFPLAVGKQVTIHRTGRNASGKSWDLDELCQVTERKNITIEAGTFDTYHILCTNPMSVDSYYYSPDAKFAILMSIHHTQHGRKSSDIISEMISYRLPQTKLREPTSKR